MGDPRSRRSHRLGRARAPRRPRPMPSPTSPMRWSPPASSTPTPTPPSSVTDPMRRPRAWRALRTPAAGSCARWRRPVQRLTMTCAQRSSPGCAPSWRRARPPSSASRVTASRPPRSCVRCGSSARRRRPVAVRVVRTFLGAHAVPPEAGSMDEYAAHRRRGDASRGGRGRSRRVLRRLLRPRVLLAGGDGADPDRRRGPGPGHPVARRPADPLRWR